MTQISNLSSSQNITFPCNQPNITFELANHPKCFFNRTLEKSLMIELPQNAQNLFTTLQPVMLAMAQDSIVSGTTLANVIQITHERTNCEAKNNCKPYEMVAGYTHQAYSHWLNNSLLPDNSNSVYTFHREIAPQLFAGQLVINTLMEPICMETARNADEMHKNGLLSKCVKQLSLSPEQLKKLQHLFSFYVNGELQGAFTYATQISTLITLNARYEAYKMGFRSTPKKEIST